MTNRNNQAGKSTRDMAKRRRKAYLTIGLIAIGILSMVWFISNNQKALVVGSGGVLFLLVLGLLFKSYAERLINQGSKAELRAIRGAKAEEKIGGLLEKLPEDFCVLHDIESTYGNIDHIVISKQNGIFLIETKAHGGTVRIDGETLLVNNKLPEKNFISQALQNAYWLKEVIGKEVDAQPWITPVIVFTNAFVSASKPVKGVIVVNKKFLLSLLQRANKPNPVNTQVWQEREKISERLETNGSVSAPV